MSKKWYRKMDRVQRGPGVAKVGDGGAQIAAEEDELRGGSGVRVREGGGYFDLRAVKERKGGGLRMRLKGF
jgi:hypothetical protein